jgi:hypothetical protein
MFEAASAAIDGAGYTTKTQAQMDYGSMHWMTFEFNPPERVGRMWWANDWLFVFMTERPAVNLEEFETDYLDAVQAPPQPGMEEPATESATESTEPTDGTPSQPDEPAETTPDAADAPTSETAPDNPDPGETAPDKPDAG